MRNTPRGVGAGRSFALSSAGTPLIGSNNNQNGRSPLDSNTSPATGSSGSGWSTPSSYSYSYSYNGGYNGGGYNNNNNNNNSSAAHYQLASPSFGSPYSSLSTPPQMPLDTRAFSRGGFGGGGGGGSSNGNNANGGGGAGGSIGGLHPFESDVFDIDHYLARSYSVQVPLVARLSALSPFEQRRQYHSVPLPPTVRDVWRLIKRLFDQARLNAECVIIALIYIERLMETRSLALTARNWIVVLSTALLTASKVWDDHASFNAEFAAILPIFTLQQLNHMERNFLTTISYELFISSATYAQFYFGLRSIQGIKDTAAIPRWYHAIGHGDGIIHATAAAAAKQVEAKTGGGGGGGASSASGDEPQTNGAAPRSESMG